MAHWVCVCRSKWFFGIWHQLEEWYVRESGSIQCYIWLILARWLLEKFLKLRNQNSAGEKSQNSGFWTQNQLFKLCSTEKCLWVLVDSIVCYRWCQATFGQKDQENIPQLRSTCSDVGCQNFITIVTIDSLQWWLVGWKWNRNESWTVSGWCLNVWILKW